MLALATLHTEASQRAGTGQTGDARAVCRVGGVKDRQPALVAEGTE